VNALFNKLKKFFPKLPEDVLRRRFKKVLAVCLSDKLDGELLIKNIIGMMRGNI
jgi:hypothetical protein